MKNTGMNFRHLYYFWVVAKEGGVTRAAERLGLAVQTISTQLSVLEQSIGKRSVTAFDRRAQQERNPLHGNRLRFRGGQRDPKCSQTKHRKPSERTHHQQSIVIGAVLA